MLLSVVESDDAASLSHDVTYTDNDSFVCDEMLVNAIITAVLSFHLN